MPTKARSSKKKPLAASAATNLGSTAKAWPEGLCETAESEALFRRGFPHLRWLTDEEVDEPAGLAARAMMTGEPMIDFAWPRAVAVRVVRGYLAIGVKYGAASPGDSAFLKALEKEGPLPEPSEWFDKALRRDLTSKDFAVEDAVFLLEALTSSDAVADAILSVLERDPSVMQRRGDALEIGRCLGFVLLRVEDTEKFSSRIRALRDEVAGRTVAPTRFWSGLVETLADGDAAFEKFGHALKYYVFVKDRTRLVEKLKTAPGEFLPDLRFVYLGGPEVLDLYERRLDELPKGGLARRFFEALKHLKRPLAEPLMKRLALRSDVGPLARGWLEGH
jgi:hypothetical protein